MGSIKFICFIPKKKQKTILLNPVGGNNCDDKSTNADLEINRSSMFSFLGGDVSAGVAKWTGVSGCTSSHLSG